MPEKDFLWLHLKDLPYFRSLLRAVEARFYQDIDLPAPVLDVGCGDGHFASVTFARPLDVGIDPWESPLRKAAGYGGYRALVQGDGAQMPFPDGHFGSAVSNSVLEHIPPVEAVLRETARVLRPGALFVFCVPNDRFLDSLSVGRALDRAGLGKLGDSYRAFFNRIARHIHCDPPEVWQGRLERAGFRIERWWHYFPPRAMQISEWGHYFGLPSLLIHGFTRRWILAPARWNLALTRRIVEPFYRDNPVTEEGVCTFYITKRTG
jgi:SAM-dependent methyltransferase